MIRLKLYNAKINSMFFFFSFSVAVLNLVVLSLYNLCMLFGIGRLQYINETRKTIALIWYRDRIDLVKQINKFVSENGYPH